jgi:hypothetical protein
MKLHMRSCAVAAAVCAAVVALTIPSVAAAAGAQQFDIPFSGVGLNPCSGEEVAIEGVFHDVVRAGVGAEDAAGGSHFVIHQNVHLSGVGLTTGARYELDNSTNVSGYSSTGTTEVTTVQPFTFVGQGTVPNFTFFVHQHITITPSGDVTSQIDVTTGGCQSAA